ncbi:unnamed protein product [Cuscuta campestris]|uniref:RNase H type-1 domain-containing protein n=1 Tax=Cuscuta campestris TaxID=132261 RepID=A0A484KLK9_9ASTE|nr:unnamed protein product [Cuscuta campestris]
MQGYNHVMAMMEQSGGYMLYGYPGMCPMQTPGLTPLQIPGTTPTSFVPRMIHFVEPVNLVSEMNQAGPSRPAGTPDGHVVSVTNEEEWDEPRTDKGKGIAKPTKTRDSAFKCLGSKNEGPRKSAKFRLGHDTVRPSAFERHGGVRRKQPAQSRRPKGSQGRHLEEGEAESQSRASAYTRLSYGSADKDFDEIGFMARKLQALEDKVERSGRNKHTLAKSPFTASVHMHKMTQKIKLDVEKFTGKEDPDIHLDTFHNAAQMAGCTDAEECLLFFSSLRGRPVEWFNKLPQGKIGSFEKLAEIFRRKYQDNCIKRKKFTYLNTVGQREKETLIEFLTRWREEMDKLEEIDDKTVMSLLMNAFRSGELYTKFCRRPPASYQEAYNTAWEYGEAENLNHSKRELEEGYKAKSSQTKKEDQSGGSMSKTHHEGIVHEIRDDKKGGKPKKPWTKKWCTYHQSDSHNTTECRSMNVLLQEMVNKGEFSGEYTEEARKANSLNHPGEGEKDKAKKPATRKEYITMIAGGPEGGDTASQRKNWARSLNLATVLAEPRTGEDHNDPLVITMDINGADVGRVLVDTGSSVNVLYLETFKKLKLDRSQLEPLQTPLSGFTGATIEAEGTITLPVELGTGSKVVSKRMKFVVVDIHCVHNAILRRPGINQVRAIISMTHLCMKFYTPHGIGEERGDRKNARSCNLEAVKKMTCLFERIKVISQQVEKGEEKQRLEPDSSTEEVQIDSAIPERVVRIGTGLPIEQKDAIIQVLTRYNSLFAWSVVDMPGIDRSVICHHLSVMEGSHPVRQKKRYLASERREFVKKEVKDLLGAHPIVVLTDQPLGMVMRNSTSSGRIIKWAMMLTQFNIEYRPRTAIKGQAVVDFLVEMTGQKEEEHEKVITESWWTMSVDGASRPKGYRGGVVFTTPKGFKVYHALIFKFKLTNNEAEYEALIGGLRLAKSLHVSRLVIKSDSSLVVGHVNGNMEAKGEKMQQYRDLVMALLRDMEEYKLEQIPRRENTDADLLSKLTQAAPEHVSKLAKIEMVERSSIERQPVGLVMELDRVGLSLVEVDDFWMTDLVKYLMTRKFPEEDDHSRKVKLRAPRFQLFEGKLYKRAFGGPLLRCLTKSEAERVVAEVHEGVYAAHQMSRTLAQRIILLGYYWPTMNMDCERYVHKCPSCQIFYKFPGRPATYYHPVSNIVPFARFGLDIVGAFPVAQAKDFGITHNKASVAYPQGNGQVKNANRTIVDGIKKRLGEAKKNWLEELPHIIWAYRVTSRRATGETPFALTYGCEARFPIEAKIPTFREAEYSEEENNESHMAELNMVEERRAMAKMKMMEYQQTVKAYHDNKVGPRYFQVGDEVLRRGEASKPGDGGKLAKKWEGPYKVTAIIRPGTYKLETLEGKEVERLEFRIPLLHKPVHASPLRLLPHHEAIGSNLSGHLFTLRLLEQNLKEVLGSFRCSGHGPGNLSVVLAGPFPGPIRKHLVFGTGINFKGPDFFFPLDQRIIQSLILLLKPVDLLILLVDRELHSVVLKGHLLKVGLHLIGTGDMCFDLFMGSIKLSLESLGFIIARAKNSSRESLGELTMLQRQRNVNKN